jgi:hypothetical protein
MLPVIINHEKLQKIIEEVLPTIGINNDGSGIGEVECEIGRFGNRAVFLRIALLDEDQSEEPEPGFDADHCLA